MSHPIPMAASDAGAAGTAQATRIRLDFLDGIRGLCAVYIIFYHIDQLMGITDWSGFSLLQRTIFLVTKYGYYAVPVFIVLSGYCLMLPVARTADGHLRGGALMYLRRRARRILPPYYFALAFSLIVFFLTVPLQRTIGSHSVVTISPSVLLGHLFLLQNFVPGTSGNLDPPMWSIATEWQIYFVFPMVLLPLWHRFGNIAPLAAAFAIGLVPHFLFHRAGDDGAPWYLGLFALGMIAAVLSFSVNPRQQRIGAAIPWSLASGIFFLFWIGCVVIHISWQHYRWLAETVVGLTAICLILSYARQLIQGTSEPLPVGLRLLSSPWVVGLGKFSYSIYLIHFPVVWTVEMILRSRHVSDHSRYSLLLLIAAPLAISIAYLFHRLFERPFMSEFAKPK